MMMTSVEQENAVVRRPSLRVFVGDVRIGNGAPVVIQSMIRTPLGRVEAALDEIRELAVAGCQVVRAALPDPSLLHQFEQVAAESPLPIVADVHAPIQLAADGILAGAAAVRVNPLMPGPLREWSRLAHVAAEHHAVVRVGLNVGRWPSERTLTAAALVDAVELATERLVQAGLESIKVSIKATDSWLTIEANRLLSRRVPWPVHLGLTESGTAWSGAIRSAATLGILLVEGIGDTIRISLSGRAVDEVLAARILLRTLGLRADGVRVTACPGCGRAHQDVAAAAQWVERELADLVVGIDVAVMGCEINGPGEARHADVGIAATKSGWVLFKQGRQVTQLGPNQGPVRLVAEARHLALARERR
ncbi:MAG: flavodoxin-dependent (E)-4-hydroxy-3-methylbut-2-enyl-diphosphate synthase [Deltaproteobacteria bacterium]|nr:flavodoxin-dependent (E)-4-hydroxy-3-methylbut-2-enyl-diphosphate synthase [Deltaproteobacteria bacterium]